MSNNRNVAIRPILNAACHELLWVCSTECVYLVWQWFGWERLLNFWPPNTMDEEPERAKRWEGGYERTWWDCSAMCICSLSCVSSFPGLLWNMFHPQGGAEGGRVRLTQSHSGRDSVPVQTEKVCVFLSVCLSIHPMMKMLVSSPAPHLMLSLLHRVIESHGQVRLGMVSCAEPCVSHMRNTFCGSLLKWSAVSALWNKA